MAKLKSSRGTAVAQERKAVRNRPIRSALKTAITKAEKMTQVGNVEEARELAIAAGSALDRAVIKGVIHPNNAARRKSRLMKKVNNI